MSGARGINKPRGLLTVYFLLKMAVEKSVFDIDLMNRPILRQGKREDDMNGGGFENMAESLVQIDTRLLSESMYNPSSFMMGKRSIRVVFVAKIHLPLKIFVPGGGETRVNVLLAMRASYSSCMVRRQELSCRAVR
jgi:hypothetical protein